MSEQANLEVIKAAYAAFSRGDIDAVVNACADDVEWDAAGPAEVPQAGLFRGKSGVADFFRILADAEEPQFLETEAFVAQGERVLVLGHYSARVRSTGHTAQADFVHSFVMRDGKVVKYRQYYDTARYAQAYHAATAGV
jgi:ketosteroid isomerase-like protein